MTSVDRKMEEINNKFRHELRLNMTENEKITEDLRDALVGKIDSESRSEKINRWKETIDNINYNLNANIEYPEELTLLIIENSIKHPPEEPQTSEEAFQELLEAISSSGTEGDEDEEYEDEEEEYETDEEYERRYRAWLKDEPYEKKPEVVYVEREVPVYSEPEKPKRRGRFWKSFALAAGTSYVSYKAGRKFGKWLM